MGSIVVTESELKVNGYPTGELPDLGFEFDYLYYEPDGENLFKLVNVGGEYVRAELLDAEKTACADFCASFEPVIVEAPVVEEPTEVDPEVFVVGEDGVTPIVKSQSELTDSDVVITREQLSTYPQGTSFEFFNFMWDAEQQKFVPKTYIDARLYAYYTQVKFGDQLEAIWAFIKSSGLDIPAETQAIIDKVEQIKTEIPKS